MRKARTKNTSSLKWPAIIICMVFASACIADNYKITYIHNYSTVNIGGHLLKVNDSFSDKMPIKWRPQQFFRAKNGTVERYFTQKAFSKLGAKSVKDYLSQEKVLYVRGNDQASNHYSQKDHYLADSLHFKAEPTEPGMYAEGVCFLDGQEIVTPISRTADGAFYIITPDIFGGHTPQDVKLDIRERNESGDWIENVYSNIPIIAIPLIEY